jgi:hypothetical protein
MTRRARAVDAMGRVRDRVVTADAVYGTILFAALVAVASDEEGTEALTIDVGEAAIDRVESLTVLLVAGGSLVAFFLAHVYARTIAGHGVRRGEDVPVGRAFREAVRESAGMLLAAIPSTLLLLLGAIGILPDAPDWALLVAVVVLFVLGYQALAERGSAVWRRIVGGLVSALLGLVVIAIDIAAH